MNNTQAKLARKLERLTQRLEFKIQEVGLTPEENRKATEEYTALAAKLTSMIPDPTFSTDERLERAVKITLAGKERKDRMESDAAKLRRLQRRLDELVPGSELTHTEKLDHLANLLIESVNPVKA